MGELMSHNDGRLLGFYDELSAFLGKLNISRGRGGISDTHELSKLLELYNGSEWSRSTGKCLWRALVHNYYYSI